MGESTINPNNYFGTIPYIPTTQTRAQFEEWRTDTLANVKILIDDVPESLKDILVLSLESLEIPFYLMPALMIYTINMESVDKSLTYKQITEFYNSCELIVPIRFADEMEGSEAI